MYQRKNFENWLIFGEDMDKSKVARFLWPTVYICHSDGSLARFTDTPVSVGKVKSAGVIQLKLGYPTMDNC